MCIKKITIVSMLALSITSCGLIKSEGQSRSYYFKDTVDNGNDADTAGCHVEYLTSACSDRQVVGVVGDSCLSEVSINEYTNNRTCHEHNTNTEPADLSSLNCNEACGSRGGKCEVVENACVVRGITSNSARCVCNK